MAFQKAIEIAPEGHSGWHYLGVLLSALPGRAADAEAAFRKADELSSECASCWVGLGNLVARAGRSAEAETAYRRAIELDPQSFRAWLQYGRLLANAPKRTAEAESAFRKIIALDPSWPGVWQDLGTLLEKIRERLPDAEAAFRKAIELDPSGPGCWYHLGGLLATMPGRQAEAESAYRKAIELNPKSSASWRGLGKLLADIPERLDEAESALRRATDIDPRDGQAWADLDIFHACRTRQPRDAADAFRRAIQVRPGDATTIRNLGILLYCELGDLQGGLEHLERAAQLDANNPVTRAILAAANRGLPRSAQREFPTEAAQRDEFWDELLDLCRNYPPFGKILLFICDLVQEIDGGNRFVDLFRALALGQLHDFPRASVAFEDSLVGDPIEMLAYGQQAIETTLAAAVASGRVREFIDVLDRKEWKDAWRPIYEALRAVESGSAEYLRRIAVEFRAPALDILGRIAPHLA